MFAGDDMNIWGKIRVDNNTVDSCVVSISEKSASEVSDWGEAFASLCHDLNLSRPVILKKHVRELEQFSHTVFLPADFIESVGFDRLEIELY